MCSTLAGKIYKFLKGTTYFFMLLCDFIRKKMSYCIFDSWFISYELQHPFSIYQPSFSFTHVKKFTNLQLLKTSKLPYGDRLTWFNLFCVSAESMRLGLTQRSTEQRLNFWFSSYSSFYSKICRIHRLQVKNLSLLQNMQKAIPYKHSDRVKAQSECKDIVDTLF